MKTMKEQLVIWCKAHPILQVEKPKEKAAGKSKPKAPFTAEKREHLSDRDLLELMGMNRQVLKRGKGGAYK